MTYYAIYENGFVSKITAKDDGEAYLKFDEASISEDGNGILMEEKVARGVARTILARGKEK
jgi:hypothetical protein